MRTDPANRPLAALVTFSALWGAGCVSSPEESAQELRIRSRRTTLEAHDSEALPATRTAYSGPTLWHGNLESLEGHLMPIQSIPVPEK